MPEKFINILNYPSYIMKKKEGSYLETEAAK